MRKFFLPALLLLSTASVVADQPCAEDSCLQETCSAEIPCVTDSLRELLSGITCAQPAKEPATCEAGSEVDLHSVVNDFLSVAADYAANGECASKDSCTTEKQCEANTRCSAENSAKNAADEYAGCSVAEEARGVRAASHDEEPRTLYRDPRRIWEPRIVLPNGVTREAQITHLERATIHLRAAGMRKEADRVEAAATKLQSELTLEKKLAARAQLDEEISQLQKLVYGENHAPDSDSQQLVLHCQVITLSPSRLKAAGIDLFGRQSDDATATLDAEQCRKLIEAIETKKAGKVIARPTLITVSGTLAYFNSLGQVPVVQNDKQGNRALNYHDFGTALSIRPTLLSNGTFKVQASAELARLEASSAADESDAPRPLHNDQLQVEKQAFEARANLKPGETLVLGSSVQRSKLGEATESFRIPFLNTPVRIVKSFEEELQTVVLVTPESIDTSAHTERTPRINAASLEIESR